MGHVGRVKGNENAENCRVKTRPIVCRKVCSLTGFQPSAFTLPQGEGKTESAFTLAETLIALVIIGIIAAITIPAISRASERYILRNQFKKTYSAFVNAMNKAESDMGGNVQCFYPYTGNAYRSADCRKFFKELLNNYSVQKVCNGNAKLDGCIPDPYMKSYSASFFTQNKVENTAIVYNLADGTIVITDHWQDTPLFLLDVNGAKGPNTIGKDIFQFLIESDNVNGLRIRNNAILGNSSSKDRYFAKISDIYKE